MVPRTDMVPRADMVPRTDSFPEDRQVSIPRTQGLRGQTGPPEDRQGSNGRHGLEDRQGP